ncbi:sensor histidine kinase [Gemmatimonas sp.]|uniref:sensor histidine kinase n=1 Tax=Gemmatimonas sp. TaxID=1962908 RepID=UPI0031C6C6CE|nr:HAMP domain-containing histidine kinase [Gemmatimonas sp.]
MTNSPVVTTSSALSSTLSSTQIAPDVSPEAIAALVAEGARVLVDSPADGVAAAPQVIPDALQLLVGITHDLRSPLSSMLMLIERLRSGHAGPVTPQQEKQLGLLYSAAFGVASLTNDALDMARGTAHDVAQGAAVPFSVAEVWKGVRALVHPIAEEKQLVLRWSGPAADRRVGYPGALHRVLLNLVTNALKFTLNGSVTVSASDVGNDRLRFEVADTGHGLPAAVKAQLLRAEQLSTDPLLSSAGLGIAMCQQMLAAMDSRLEDVSEEGRPGATLAFVLTLAAQP